MKALENISFLCLSGFLGTNNIFLASLQGPPNLLTMNGTSAWSWVTTGSPLQQFPGIQLSKIYRLLTIFQLIEIHILSKVKASLSQFIWLELMLRGIASISHELDCRLTRPPGHVV